MTFLITIVAFFLFVSWSWPWPSGGTVAIALTVALAIALASGGGLPIAPVSTVALAPSVVVEPAPLGRIVAPPLEDLLLPFPLGLFLFFLHVLHDFVEVRIKVVPGLCSCQTDGVLPTIFSGHLEY